MASQGVMTHNVLDVELLDSFAYNHYAKAKFSGLGFPPGKFSSGVSNDGSVESEDDSMSTGCSDASLSSRRTSRTSSDTAPGSWPDVEAVCALAQSPPGFHVSHSTALYPPGVFDAQSVTASLTQEILSHVGPPPGLGFDECSTEEVDSAVPLPPPGQHLAPVSYPPGMFQWNVDQPQPLVSGESKSWVAQSVSRRGTVYSCSHTQVVEPQASAPEVVPDHERTTIMVRNLPSSFSRDTVVEVLDQEGFKGRYDFVYMPMNFKKGAVFGYAFVNLLTPADALEAKDHLQGLSWPGSNGTVDVLWCGTQQGLEALVERFRSSPVMHEVVPDAVRPAVYSGGVRSIFPPPTKPIKMPNMRADCD